MFFHPNDGTVPYPNNDDNILLWERISDLEGTIERQRARIDELNQQLQRYEGRVMYGDYVPVRDDQRLNRDMVLNFQDRDYFLQNIREQQLNRLAHQLLENDLIEHTFRPDEPNGDYFSRMEIKVVRNI